MHPQRVWKSPESVPGPQIQTMGHICPLLSFTTNPPDKQKPLSFSKIMMPLVLSRPITLAALLLILVQPVTVLAGGWETDRSDDAGAPKTRQTASPHQAPDRDDSARIEAGQAPAFSPEYADSLSQYAPRMAEPGRYLPVLRMGPPCDGPISDLPFPAYPMREPLPTSAYLESGPLMDGPASPIVHRGELDLDEIHRSSASPLLFSGPNTPPPTSGDWMIDKPGNNVNNTTIILNGNLKVTTGDLTLDNVTLIINCTSDGQYGINVSAGGALNLVNDNITAFNGAHHYKFAVFGNMTMDRCNVSEMWGDKANREEGGGVAIFAGETRILSSTISNGESSGIQVHGIAGPEITATTVSRNGHNGIMTFDNGRPTIRGCDNFGNTGNGISIIDSSCPSLTDSNFSGNGFCGISLWDDSTPNITFCTVTGNTGHGIQLWDSARPVISNCTSAGNSACGIAAYIQSAPKFTNCTSLKNTGQGINVLDSAEPDFTDCTSMENNECGIAVWNNSIPKFKNCTAMHNSGPGIQIADFARPEFADCTITNNSYNGVSVFDFTKPEFTNCTVAGNDWDGIVVANNSVPIFTNCNITNNSFDGVAAIDVAKPEFTNCTFAGNNVRGILADVNSAPIFTNCTVINNSYDGIVVTDSAKPEFTNSASAGNNGNGIIVDVNSAPIFSNCTCMGNNWQGIAVLDNAAPIFASCTIINNSQHGIAITDFAQPEFTDCNSSGNNMCGINILANSTPTFTNCAVTNNSGNGIQVQYLTQPEFTDCSFTGNKWCGITVWENSIPTFTNCTATNNSQHGISVANLARPELVNCTSTGNTFHGIATFNNSCPVLTGCTFMNNQLNGISVLDSSEPVITRCVISNNRLAGLKIVSSAFPRLEGLYLFGNGGQNLWVTSTIPLVLPNSTLAGGSSFDVMLSNNSKLTLLNTTYTKQAVLTAISELKVEWYLTFTVLDRAKKPVPGAKVMGTGMNGSLIPAVFSGPDGVARDLVATEYIQNTTGSDSEFTYFSPYDFLVDKDGETNVTKDFPASRSLSWWLYFDYCPRIEMLPDTTVIEDRALTFDLTPYLSDPDNPLSMLGFNADRDYITVDNASRHLAICCPTALGSDTITITVSDGLKSSNQTLFIVVTPVNDAPRCVVDIPDRTVFEDQTLVIELTHYFSDEESGSQLTYTSNRGLIAIDNELRQASWTPGEGNLSLEGVVITASDGYLTGDSNPFNITFMPVNDPPVYLGGLEGTTVREHENWTANLDNHFRDEEDAAGLVYEASDPNISINRLTHEARWSPSGNSVFTIDVIFTAHEAANYSMTVSSNPITLRYQPVNDPPVYLGKLQNVRLKLGEEWNITLEDQFRDDDSGFLRFSVNYSDVKIVEMDKNRHLAIWKPDKYSQNITGLIITAYDGQTYVRSAPMNLTFDKPASPDNKPSIVRLVQSIPWYFYPLIPTGIIGGALAFYAYRRVKYGKYVVEQVFLINKDGRLLAHKARKPLEGGGEDIISGMLTALQGFIKEFLRDEKQGELEEMKYGDLKIVIERGQRVYLAVFLSGYVTEELKTDLKLIIQKVDTDMGGVLDSWDGTVKMLDGLKVYLEKLIVEEDGGR